MHSDPHLGIEVKMTSFWGVYPSFWGSNPLGEGVPWKTLLLLKKTPPEGGPVTPFWGVIPWISLLLLKKYLPEPHFWGVPPFLGQNDPFFRGFIENHDQFWKKPSKNRFFTVNTLKNRFLSVISHYFHYKHTQKRFFHCKHTHFWVFWPILGGTPLWGVYTPQKNRQKRTLFNSSQSSYRAKSNQSSSNFMKPQSRALLTRILKEKMPFFPRVSLGKVAHTNFKGDPSFPLGSELLPSLFWPPLNLIIIYYHW